MKVVYQHFAKKHLHRYASEFELRYNNRSANGVEEYESAFEKGDSRGGVGVIHGASASFTRDRCTCRDPAAGPIRPI
jgi:hypothetical protein